MKAFYSIIKVSPNSITGDNVSIGVVMFDGTKFQYHFSEKKKKIAIKLIESNSIDLDFVIKQFAYRFEEINNEFKDLKLFSRFENLRGLSYFDYLNKYSNGLVQFSSPFIINENVNGDLLNKIVTLLFDESLYTNIRLEENKSFEVELRVNEKLINPIKDLVHTNYKFNSNNLPSIYFPFEMECIGLNGSLIGAKSLPFDKKKQALDTSVSHYFTLISTLSNKYNKQLKENSFFLISDEPSDIKSPEHALWESVNTNELIKVIPSEEAHIVANLVLDKKAHRFLD